jgi:hypothetical protein
VKEKLLKEKFEQEKKEQTLLEILAKIIPAVKKEIKENSLTLKKIEIFLDVPKCVLNQEIFPDWTLKILKTPTRVIIGARGIYAFGEKELEERIKSLKKEISSAFNQVDQGKLKENDLKCYSQTLELKLEDLFFCIYISTIEEEIELTCELTCRQDKPGFNEKELIEKIKKSEFFKLLGYLTAEYGLKLHLNESLIKNEELPERLSDFIKETLQAKKTLPFST